MKSIKNGDIFTHVHILLHLDLLQGQAHSLGQGCDAKTVPHGAHYEGLDVEHWERG